MIKFSIIIPTYNHGHFLRRCLDSIVNQSYTNWEAIIINNYSTDDTIGIIKSYDDSRIRLINFANKGIISAARNVGIKHSTGDWICFLDSDDAWFPDKLLRCAEVVNDEDILYTDMLCGNDIFKAKRRYKSYTLPSSDNFNKLLINGNPIINSSVCIKKTVFDKLGLLDEDRRYIGVEDFDLWLRAAYNKYKFKRVKYPLGFYYIGASNFSFSPRQITNLYNLYMKHIKNIDIETRKIILDALYCRLAGMNYYLGRYKRSWILLNKCKNIKSPFIRIKKLYFSCMVLKKLRMCCVL